MRCRRRLLRVPLAGPPSWDAEENMAAIDLAEGFSVLRSARPRCRLKENARDGCFMESSTAEHQKWRMEV